LYDVEAWWGANLAKLYIPKDLARYKNLFLYSKSIILPNEKPAMLVLRSADSNETTLEKSVIFRRRK